MVNAANAMGLKEIGITDHGYYHLFRTSKEKLYRAREIVDEINNYSNVKVLLGVEANIISEDGTIDIDSETISMLDILIVGYHRMIKTDFAGFLGGQNASNSVERATNAFINAIEKYPVTIVSHPNFPLKLDLYKLGCACRDAGVMVELNNRHPSFTKRQITDLIASECMFCVSSDAHSRSEVGRADKIFELIKKYDIPSDLVSNVEFEYSEMSELDRELNEDYRYYREEEEKREREERERQIRSEHEFDGTLSAETESALEEITKSKHTKERSSVEASNRRVRYYSDSVNQLIRQAEEILKNRDVEAYGDEPEKEGSSTEPASSEPAPSKEANPEPANQKSEANPEPAPSKEASSQPAAREAVPDETNGSNEGSEA